MEISTGRHAAAAPRVCELDGEPADYHLTAWLAAPWPHFVKGFLCTECRYRLLPGLDRHGIAYQCVMAHEMLG